MPTVLTIRRLDESTYERLRTRASEHQRSLEAEAREILSEAVQPRSSQGWLDGLRARARARTAGRPQRDSALLIADGRDDR
jgi:hypothetical protein